MLFNKIAPDKWKHFFVGIAMGLFLQATACWFLPDHLYIAIVTSFIIVFIISYGFELFSKFTGLGRYDVMDAVASIIGAVLGMAVILSFVWIDAR